MLKSKLNLFIIFAALALLAHTSYAVNHTVKMVADFQNKKFYFEPKELTVQSGDSVTWVNMQNMGHNIIASSVPKGAKKFKSPMIRKKGGEWTAEFFEPGEHAYLCGPHSGLNMKGKILVDAIHPTNIATNDMHDHSSMKQKNHASPSAGIKGKGVINAIDLKKLTVNITHDPISEIGWPKMTMDLPVSKRVDLSLIENHSKVDFTLKLGSDNIYRIIDMSLAQYATSD